MPFGILDTTYIDTPQNVDAAYLESLQNGSGQSFGDLLTDLDGMIGAFNDTADPLVAMLSYPTDETFIDAQLPRAFDVQPSGQYGVPRPQFVEEVPGWMLPTQRWDVAVGWTEDGLRDMRAETIRRQLESLLMGFRLRIRKECLRRMFSPAEVFVDRQTTALSPGFAGSGTGLNVYTIPYPDGSALPGGYTHYLRSATLDAAGASAALASAADLLKKQGIEPPYDILATTAAANVLRSITETAVGKGDGFVSAGSTLVRPGQTQPEALVNAQDYIGVVRDVFRIRQAINDFTEPNFAVFKLYGNLSPQNPLALRYPNKPGLPGGGRALYLRSRDLFPLANAYVLHWFGFGVSNRVGAVLVQLAASAGAYTAPVIS